MKKKIKPTHSFFQLVLEGQGLYFQHPIHAHDLSSIHSQKLSKNPKNTQKPPSHKNRQNGVGENREKVEKVVSPVVRENVLLYKKGGRQRTRG